MDFLSTGTKKKVAFVERWAFAEVRLYFGTVQFSRN